MSHINHIFSHRCVCGARAEYEVINNRSAALGIYCKRHAKQRLAEFDREVAERIRKGLPV